MKAPRQRGKYFTLSSPTIAVIVLGVLGLKGEDEHEECS